MATKRLLAPVRRPVTAARAFIPGNAMPRAGSVKLRRPLFTRTLPRAGKP